MNRLRLLLACLRLAKLTFIIIGMVLFPLIWGIYSFAMVLEFHSVYNNNAYSFDQRKRIYMKYLLAIAIGYLAFLTWKYRMNKFYLLRGQFWESCENLMDEVYGYNKRRWNTAGAVRRNRASRRDPQNPADYSARVQQTQKRKQKKHSIKRSQRLSGQKFSSVKKRTKH
ncbi:uncharacterized protein LOC119689936 [Teleopsis dalmanni]|uniref:uncharacterized protein LOC119689936 n=1 Tax=Teleopsis dalmanni TaxID=139649 RepID=UPI000D329ACA|nr:uncharacterized protein LOC119689936 [Teleopsis dalmanni]